MALLIYMLAITLFSKKLIAVIASNDTSNDTTFSSTSTSIPGSSDTICSQMASLNTSCYFPVNCNLSASASYAPICYTPDKKVVVNISCLDSSLINNANDKMNAYCQKYVNLNCTTKNFTKGMMNVTDTASLLHYVFNLTNCSSIQPTTLPLLPNPVPPEAITAIVVLVCLFITSVLAGFFFWPKCHNPQAPPLTKKSKKEASMNVHYDVNRQTATVNKPMHPTLGPSAA